MSDLPQGWAESTLGELVTLRADKVDPAGIPEKSFLGLEDIEPHTSTILRVGTASEVKSSVACFEAGDVLYSRLRPYLNKVARPDFSGVASAEILALKPSDAAEAEFVRRKIMTREFLDFTAMLDKGDRPRVSYDEIAAFQVFLPPLPEQRRIVAKIDSLTGKSRRARDHLDHIPRLVHKYKQAILSAAFRGDAELARVGDVITDIRYGTAKKCNYDGGAVPVLRIPNVQGGRIDLGDMKSADFDAKELLKLELRTGDILVIRSNGSLDLVGRSAVVDDRAAGMLFAGYLIRLRLDPTRCLPEYLHWFLQSSVARNTITNAAKSTSGVNNVNAQELQNLELPLPSIAAQKERIASIESAFTWIERLTGDATSARKLIDYLDQSVLAKAFKGDLVPQDPTDEPASALLERIRSERAAAPKAKRGHKKAV